MHFLFSADMYGATRARALICHLLSNKQILHDHLSLGADPS